MKNYYYYLILRTGKRCVGFLFQQLNLKMLRCSISNIIKFGLYTSLTLSTALHACETWNTQHTQAFYGPFSGTTQVSRCQKRTSGLYSARED